METGVQFDLVTKLCQRLLRLIKLGEPNQQRITTQSHSHTPVDLTAHVEECVRRLFNTSCSVETFIQDVQRLLNVTIRSNLSQFLTETIPLAHEYLRQQQVLGDGDPFSWDTFKMLASTLTSNLRHQETSMTRLPSLQQARFRLPPGHQLVDLTSSLTSHASPEPTFVINNLRPNANLYEQRLVHRFAQRAFHLNECGEHLFLQTLYAFLKHIIRRLLLFTGHRTDAQMLRSITGSKTYEVTSNVREQIRFLVELGKVQSGRLCETTSNSIPSGVGLLKRKTEFAMDDVEQRRARLRDYRLTTVEQLRQKEADETACFVLRESRLKRQQQHVEDGKRGSIPMRFLRATLQDLLAVMESEPILRRSKTMLYAYANR